MHEAWEAARELYLLLREEEDPNEEQINNPAYDSLVAMNRDLRRIRSEED